MLCGWAVATVAHVPAPVGSAPIAAAATKPTAGGQTSSTNDGTDASGEVPADGGNSTGIEIEGSGVEGGDAGTRQRERQPAAAGGKVGTADRRPQITPPEPQITARRPQITA